MIAKLGKIFRYFRFYLLTVCLILLAVSCQKSNPKSQKPLRLVLDWNVNPNHIPLYVGNILGYFKDEGIHLDIIKPTLDDSLAHLESDSAEFAVTYLPRVIRATSKNRDFYVVGKIVEKPLNGFCILSNSGIKSIDDFNGRVLGYDTTHCTTALLQVLLDEKNIEFGCRLNSGIETVSDLINKRVDVLYGSLCNVDPVHIDTYGTKTRFFSVTEFGMPDYEELVVVAPGRSRKNPKQALCFQKALQKSIDFCREKPHMAFEMYMKANPEKKPQTIFWEEKSWLKTVPMLAQSQEFSYSKTKDLADWLLEKGLLRRPVEIDSHFCSMVKTDQNRAGANHAK